MLPITIPPRELWDEKNETFVQIKGATLQLEHSLVSISKWESRWKKPFLDKGVEKTYEESIDYIRCMTITQNVDPVLYLGINDQILTCVTKYIEDPMTATWFSKKDESRKVGGIPREKVTSELIYYWMFKLQIPKECEKWHLNRLLTLIQVFNIKDQPPKKMSQKQLASRNSALNAARRKRLNSKG